MKCHICENETNFTCDNCDEPVCEECCVQMTVQNQIDYPLCVWCGDDRERVLAEYYHQKEAEKAKIESERKAQSEKARATYWKSENVEKRKAKKEERKRQQEELKKKQMERVVKIISNWM